MEEIVVKECNIEYNSPFVGDKHLKTRRKCGEIFVSDEDVFHFLCTLCESPFEEIENFFNHLKYIHTKTYFSEEKPDPLKGDDNKSYAPEICLTELSDLKIDIKIEDENEVENNTNDNLPNFSDTSEVISTDNVEKNLVCERCNRVFETNYSLNVHKKHDHRSCSKELSNKQTNNNDLLEHEVKINDLNETGLSNENKRIEKTEDEIRSYKCMYCNLNFPNIPKLNDHKKSHKGEKPFTCKKCGKAFRARTTCEKHEKKHNQTYKCKLCPASYTSKKSLTSHSRRHGEKKLSCNYCNKKFFFNMEKEVHERTHTGEKPFQCSICGRCFGTSSHLNDHFKVHSCEKPFQCEICNMAFSRKNTLKSHLKIHSNKREYLCKTCGKGFNQNATLHCHMKSHEEISTRKRKYVNNGKSKYK